MKEISCIKLGNTDGRVNICITRCSGMFCDPNVTNIPCVERSGMWALHPVTLGYFLRGFFLCFFLFAPFSGHAHWHWKVPIFSPWEAPLHFLFKKNFQCVGQLLLNNEPKPSLTRHTHGLWVVVFLITMNCSMRIQLWNSAHGKWCQKLQPWAKECPQSAHAHTSHFITLQEKKIGWERCSCLGCSSFRESSSRAQRHLGIIRKSW